MLVLQISLILGLNAVILYSRAQVEARSLIFLKLWSVEEVKTKEKCGDEMLLALLKQMCRLPPR